jgi:hypothetical protein
MGHITDWRRTKLKAMLSSSNFSKSSSHETVSQKNPTQKNVRELFKK